MASSTVNQNNIHIGRGDIYLGCTVPGTPPVPLVAGVPQTGVFVGGTLGPAMINYKVTTVDVRTQQSGVLAISVVNTEDLECEFEIGELTFANIQAFFLGAGISPFGSPTASFGGQVAPVFQSLLIVAPKRDGSFHQFMIYNSYFPRDRQVTFAREKETAVKITGVGIGVFTRARGDQLGFWNTNVISG